LHELARNAVRPGRRAGRARASRPGEIAFVIQEPHRGLFARSVALEVGFSLARRRVPRSVRRDRVRELLARFDLLALAERSPHRLSFGQQHRLCLAAAFAAWPKLVLLDEPFSGLDTTARTALLDFLAEEQARNGTTLVLASHDREPLEQWSDRVIELPHREPTFHD
jgi:energy-coupling factor transporter ATP-binding protein EcfA2